MSYHDGRYPGQQTKSHRGKPANMKTYTFIIGSTDDFETIEDLIDCADRHDAQNAHWDGPNGGLNYSIFEFDCPSNCSEETVTMMGRGYAFSSDWCMDDTLSFLIEGTIQTASV